MVHGWTIGPSCKGAIMRPTNRELHELPDSKMIKSGVIRLASEEKVKLVCRILGFKSENAFIKLTGAA